MRRFWGTDDSTAWIVVLGLLSMLIAGLICGPFYEMAIRPAQTSNLGLVTYWFYRERWLTLEEVAEAALPITAYEVKPGAAQWDTVRPSYFLTTSGSNNDSLNLTTQFDLLEEDRSKTPLASMDMDGGHTILMSGSRILGDKSIRVKIPEICEPVDISWAIIDPDEDMASCVCDAGDVTCLSWWTDEGNYVILSRALDVEALADFVNGLAPVSK